MSDIRSPATMRKVIVLKWQRNANASTVTGQRYMEKVADGEALFHAWGVEFEEFETGAGNYSTAIIERADGTIETPKADMIQFIEPLSDQQARRHE